MQLIKAQALLEESLSLNFHGRSPSIQSQTPWPEQGGQTWGWFNTSETSSTGASRQRRWSVQHISSLVRRGVVSHQRCGSTWAQWFLLLYINICSHTQIHTHTDVEYLCELPQNPSTVKSPCWLIASTNIEIKVALSFSWAVPGAGMPTCANVHTGSLRQSWVDASGQPTCLLTNQLFHVLYSPERLTFNFLLFPLSSPRL